MRKRDLIAVCLQNLMRRKSRTFLTVLGVIVGCCAIVIMMSIGIGTKESQELMLSQMGDLTIINVYSQGGGEAAAKLDDSAVKAFRGIEGVEAVSPKQYAYELTLKIYAGNDQRYVCEWSNIMGLEKDAIEKLGYKLLEGSYMTQKPYSVLVGQNFAYTFKDTRRPDGMNMVDYYSAYQPDGSVGELPDPYFNPLETPLEMVIEINDGNSVDTTITQKLNVTGRLAEDYSKGYQTSEGIIMDIADLNDLIKQVRRELGQKVNTNTTYDNVTVKAGDIKYVEEIETSIKAMGYATSSMESIRKPMEEEARQKQMMLGGLGAVSLFVAALGIMNTMIMSISERTREIGVMKALGCFVKDIRAIFLLEAGVIGFVGGVVGILISLIISVIMNVASAEVPPASFDEIVLILTNVGGRISVIPLWLLGFGLLFSIVIGVGSGYYPANKAVKISALEAIKRD